MTTIFNLTNFLNSKALYPMPKDIEIILEYIEKENYNQILFDYGEIYCLTILKMFEEKEEYETCAKIIEQIKTHNYVTNSNYKTK